MREVDNKPDPSPDSPTDLTTRSWKYVVRKTVREFTDDECTDLAAALTYTPCWRRSPAIALLSLVGLADQGEQTRADPARHPRPNRRWLDRRHPRADLMTLATADQAAGVAFVVGLAGALWSASGYVGSFGRAMNRVYEITKAADSSAAEDDASSRCSWCWYIACSSPWRSS